MLASAIPPKFPIPFGANAAGGTIRSIPQASQIGVQPGAASLNDGFPPVTQQPTGSGGIPPFGQDFNGILNQISAWAQWQNAGGAVPYDSTFQAAIGGYPIGARVVSATTPGVTWRSTSDNNTSNPDTGGANWVNAQVPALSLGANGYYQLPGGLIIQWGTSSAIPTGASIFTGVVSFPIAFPTAVVCANGIANNSPTNSFGDALIIYISALTTTQVTLRGSDPQNRAISNVVNIIWLALGY